MFSPNVSMLQAVGFFVRVMKHTLGFRGQRQFDRSWNPFAQKRTAFDLSSDGFNCDLRARRIVTPRNAQRKLPVALFQYSVRTLVLQTVYDCRALQAKTINARAL